MVSLVVKVSSFVFHSISVIFSLSILYYSLPGSSLFSWHPVTTSIAVCLLMSQGLVIFDPTFSIFATKEKKQSSVNRHLIIQLTAAVLMGVGFGVIYVNKNLNSKPHFVSWHGYVGLATIVMLPFVAAGGVATNYGLKVSNLIRPYHVRWTHGVAGTLLYSLSLLTMALALNSGWAEKTIEVPVRLLLAFILCLMLIIAWDRARVRFLLKIFQITAAPSRIKNG